MYLNQIRTTPDKRTDAFSQTKMNGIQCLAVFHKHFTPDLHMFLTLKWCYMSVVIMFSFSARKTAFRVRLAPRWRNALPGSFGNRNLNSTLWLVKTRLFWEVELTSKRSSDFALCKIKAALTTEKHQRKMQKFSNFCWNICSLRRHLHHAMAEWIFVEKCQAHF